MSSTPTSGTTQRARLLALTGGAVVCGCLSRPTEIDAVAMLDATTPVAGLVVTAYPYDPQRILDSLAERAPRPRPDFSELEAELRAFVRPAFPEQEDEATRSWRATRDSVERLADSLRALERSAPGYAAAHHRFRQLYERMLQRANRRDAAQRVLTAEVRDLALRAGRAADSLRAWEREAYGGFDSAAAAAGLASGRAAQSAETGPDGRAAFTLPRGTWWLEARRPHAENPFLEIRWLVPVTTAGFPVRVPLFSRYAVLGWRH